MQRPPRVVRLLRSPFLPFAVVIAHILLPDHGIRSAIMGYLDTLAIVCLIVESALVFYVVWAGLTKGDTGIDPEIKEQIEEDLF